MKKHLQYLVYLIRHKWFVFLACCRYGLFWRGLVHDWSKFLPSEWFPYARYFYSRWSKPHSIDAFNAAWLKHQHRNAHHWQHWVLRNDDGTTAALPMPRRFLLEMLADWEGAGRAITGRTGTTPDWYARNRDKMLLHPDTRAAVDRALGYGEISATLPAGTVVRVEGRPVRLTADAPAACHHSTALLIADLRR